MSDDPWVRNYTVRLNPVRAAGGHDRRQRVILDFSVRKRGAASVQRRSSQPGRQCSKGSWSGQRPSRATPCRPTGTYHDADGKNGGAATTVSAPARSERSPRSRRSFICHPISDPLSTAAYELCATIWRDGAFADQLKRIPNGQPAACPEVIEALRARCPGHTQAIHQQAIARGMHESLF